MPKLLVVLLLTQIPLFLTQKSLSFLSCTQKRKAKVVGGFEAERHEMPFIASLMRRKSHFCGGAVIHERWLVTAGHCICNGFKNILKPNQIQAVVGLHSLSEFVQKRQPFEALEVDFKSLVPHPGYTCTQTKDDIALLELAAALQFTPFLQPICLAVDKLENSFDNNKAIVSGWGWTHENQEQGERSDVLRKATVQIWSNSECRKSYQSSGNGKSTTVIRDTQMCAGYENGGIDSCWADSGGPLITQENLLVGIVSTGIGCARPNLPGIYTRVSKYIKWIETVIQKN